MIPSFFPKYLLAHLRMPGGRAVELRSGVGACERTCALPLRLVKVQITRVVLSDWAFLLSGSTAASQ